MKKMLLTLALLLGFCALDAWAQNPPDIKGSNGIQRIPGVYNGVRLFTNNFVPGSTNLVYGWDGTKYRWMTLSAAASAAGSNTQLQYNDSGSFGADSNLLWDKTNKTLTVGNIVFGQTFLSNTVAGGYREYTSATWTNKAAAFMGDWDGAITLGNAGGVTYNTLKRDGTYGGWYFNTAPSSAQRLGFNIDTVFGFGDGSASAGTTSIAGGASVVYRCDASSGGVQMVLPAANQYNSRWIYFAKTDSTTNMVSVSVSSGSIGEGGTNRFVNARGEQLVAFCDGGSTWHVWTQGVLPRTFYVDQNAAQVITGSALSYNIDTTFWGNILTYQSPPANADKLDYGVAMLAYGTNYYADVWYTLANNGGILDVYVGDNKIGSIDQYASGMGKNQLAVLGPFSVTNAYNRISTKINSKNGSSSDYYTYFNHMVIRYKQ